MNIRKTAAIAAVLALAAAGGALAQYSTANYHEQGTGRWSVGGGDGLGLEVESGGVLNVKSGGALKFAGTDKASILAAAVANPVAGVASGYKLARGVDAVTGTLDKTTGLATVVACAGNLAEDLALTGTAVSFTIPTQSGGTAGHVTLKMWKPTAADDVTPLAADAAKNVSWICLGT